MKSPKLQLHDTGLLHHLLGIEWLEGLSSHHICGQSWESFVVEDIGRRELLAYPHSQLYFWRTSAGAEIDLVIERDGATRPVAARPRTAKILADIPRYRTSPTEAAKPAGRAGWRYRTQRSPGFLRGSGGQGLRQQRAVKIDFVSRE